MAAKELMMNVVLGGRTTSGFDALAGKVTGLGSLLSEISDYALDFEKESIETYKNYETYMLEAEGALTAQYKSASQLSRVMEEMDDHAQEWAESTIFDTQDVAKSISEAAHAGWDYEKMVEGIPQAMLLAQAGNLDLSTALNYVIKTLNATKTPFEEAGTLIDQWAMAANSGATDIGELGEALLRMGATANFADSNAELLTMLAVLANMGTVGAEAGTLVRNSMIRLIAPTEKASEVMASLGLTYEEAQEIASDDAMLDKANELLEDAGFSAYDSTGKLKPFLDIYRELYTTVNGMAEVDKNAVLSAIFPTRTITGALGFLQAAANNYDGLYEKIIDSDGYAARIAEIQTSGLMGTLENLGSKWEEFHRQFGETGAPALTWAAEGLGDMLDVVNSWPEETFAAMVGGVTTIAAAGPGLMIAGGAMKMFSTLGVKGTAIALMAVSAGALYGYMSKMNELDFESNFGKMQLDLDALGEHVDSLSTKFSTEAEAVSKWSGALATAQEEYSELATLFSEDLLSAALTGKTLSEPEKTQLFEYGKGITDATLAGIQSASDSDMTFLDMLFGDMQTDSEKQAFIDSVGWTDDYYSGLTSEAYAIGQSIRNALTAALQDGSLNEAERQAIQSSVDRLNEIQAEINKQMSKEEYYTQLYKAQSVSWDSLDAFMTENAAKQEAELERLEEMYADLWGHQKAANEYAMENAASDAERAELEAEWANFQANFDRELNAARESTRGKYGQLAFEAFDALMNDSDYEAAWNYMKRIESAGAMNADRSTQFNYGAYLNAGESADEMNAWLSALDKGSGKMLEVLRPFADSDTLDRIESIFLGVPNAAREMAGIAIQQDFFDSFSFDNEAASEQASEAGEAANAGLMEGYGEPLLDAQVDEAGINAAATAAGTSGAAALEAAWGHPVLTATVSYSGIGSFKSIGGGKTALATQKMSLFAEGGRATEPSIFGEVPGMAEWAIPEEHSARTAELLDAARAASGFTWGELISRTGGLNANVNHKPIELHYAPVIHAADASGVERALLNDKSRLMSLLKEIAAETSLRDDVEVYV